MGRRGAARRLPGHAARLPGPGSHASYFEAGSHATEVWFDIADGQRGAKRPTLMVIDDSTAWVRWPGRWGDTDAGDSKIDQPSPPGPAQHGQWRHPEGLLATARTRPPAKVGRPLSPPETSVETHDGKLDVLYDLRGHAHEPPVTLIVTINSLDEPNVAPRTHTRDVEGDHGRLRTGLEIDPKRRYDIRVSSLDATRIPTASTLTIIAPGMAGGLFVRFRQWLGELVRRLTRRGRAPQGP